MSHSLSQNHLLAIIISLAVKIKTISQFSVPVERISSTL